MADPTSAQEQRDQMTQQTQGQTGFGSGSDDFAQTGKTGNANGASMGQDAAVDANDDGDVEQASQAGYGSNPQQGGMNDDPNSTPAIGGAQSNSDPQMEQDEAMIDDEDMDGANASSAGGGM
jgi:hypothetical protein